MVVDACLGGWSGEIAGGQAPFGAWRGDACRRLRTCGPCRESRCSARPAPAPRLRAQHGRRHSVVSLSLRLPGSVLLSCALVLLCAGPRRPHAMRRGDPGSGSREPPAFSFLPARPVALGFGTTRDGRHGPRRAWRFRTPAGSPRRSPRVARATEKLGSQSGVPDPPPLSLVFESRAAGRRVGPRTRTVWVSFEARSIV